jgi:hypothetical protein
VLKKKEAGGRWRNRKSRFRGGAEVNLAVVVYLRCTASSRSSLLPHHYPSCTPRPTLPVCHCGFACVERRAALQQSASFCAAAVLLCVSAFFPSSAFCALVFHGASSLSSLSHVFLFHVCITKCIGRCEGHTRSFLLPPFPPLLLTLPLSLRSVRPEAVRARERERTVTGASTLAIFLSSQCISRRVWC